jgi:hypothetical protein
VVHQRSAGGDPAVDDELLDQLRIVAATEPSAATTAAADGVAFRIAGGLSAPVAHE